MNRRALLPAIAAVVGLLGVSLSTSHGHGATAGERLSLMSVSLPFPLSLQWIAPSARIGSERLAFAQFQAPLHWRQLRAAAIERWSAAAMPWIERSVAGALLLSVREPGQLITLWIDRADGSGNDPQTRGYLLVADLAGEPDAAARDPLMEDSLTSFGADTLVPAQFERLRPIEFDDDGQRSLHLALRTGLPPGQAQRLLTTHWGAAGLRPMQTFGANGQGPSPQPQIAFFAGSRLELLARFQVRDGQTYVWLIARQLSRRNSEVSR